MARLICEPLDSARSPGRPTAIGEELTVYGGARTMSAPFPNPYVRYAPMTVVAGA